MVAIRGRRAVVGLASAALIASGLAGVAAGTASAAPITGSADAVANIFNSLGLANVAVSKNVAPPELGVTVNGDGSVGLKMSNPNTNDLGTFTACGLMIVPALEAPPNGVVTMDRIPGAVYPSAVDAMGKKIAEDFFVSDVPLDKTTQVLDPGVYAVSSNCARWTTGAEFLQGKPAIGTTANQPFYFVTLGALGDMF